MDCSDSSCLASHDMQVLFNNFDLLACLATKGAVNQAANSEDNKQILDGSD